MRRWLAVDWSAAGVGMGSGLGKLREGAKADEETAGKARGQQGREGVRFRRRDGIEEGNRFVALR